MVQNRIERVITAFSRLSRAVNVQSHLSLLSESDQPSPRLKLRVSLGAWRHQGFERGYEASDPSWRSMNYSNPPPSHTLRLQTYRQNPRASIRTSPNSTPGSSSIPGLSPLTAVQKRVSCDPEQHRRSVSLSWKRSGESSTKITLNPSVRSSRHDTCGSVSLEVVCRSEKLQKVARKEATTTTRPTITTSQSPPYRASRQSRSPKEAHVT